MIIGIISKRVEKICASLFVISKLTLLRKLLWETSRNKVAILNILLIRATLSTPVSMGTK